MNEPNENTGATALDLEAIERRLPRVLRLTRLIPQAELAVDAEIAMFDVETLLAAVRERDAEIARLKQDARGLFRFGFRLAAHCTREQIEKAAEGTSVTVRFCL